jgi:hypothetical protein
MGQGEAEMYVGLPASMEVAALKKELADSKHISIRRLAARHQQGSLDAA